MNNSDLPIYPTGHQNNDGTLDPYHYSGLTKREYFAGVAFQGITSNSSFVPNDEDVKYAAALSVKAADALLLELSKTP